MNYVEKIICKRKTKFCETKDRVVSSYEHTPLRDSTFNLAVFLNWLVVLHALTKTLFSAILGVFSKKVVLKKIIHDIHHVQNP